VVKEMTKVKTLTALTLMFLLVPILFVSGCTGELSAEEIAEQIQQKEASIPDYSYTTHMTYYIGDQTQESELQILQKKPNMIKTVIIEPEEEAGSVAVSDGEFMWTYDPKTNTVMKMELPETPAEGEMDYVGFISTFLNETEVSLIGIEEVDQRSSYVLEAIPKEEESAQLIDRFKLWVDKETWMPLRYEMYDSTGNLAIELEIRDLEINTGIPDSEFVFKVPEGATVKTMDMESFEISEYTNLEEAEESVGFEVLSPEYLPEGYEFDHATAYNTSEIVPDGQAAETVILTYMKGAESMVITETVYESQAPEAAIMDSAEDIDINGRDGKYLAFGDMKILKWEIGNIDLSLTASLEKDEMLRIAESIS
jgi:outer membrane lipoprotein-sorting protein